MTVPQHHPTARRRPVVVAGLAVAALAAAGWWVGSDLWRGDAAAPQQPAAKSPPAETVETLRPRLVYEAKAGGKKPQLTAEASSHLSMLERHLREERRVAARRRVEALLKADGALGKLHDKSVAGFIDADGFGIERLPVFLPKSFESPEAKPIILATTDGISEAGAGARVELPRAFREKLNPLRLPAFASLDQMHREGQQSFANLAGFAFVPGMEKDQKFTFDFHPHAFRHRPEPQPAAQGPEAKKGERWELKRLELVSLLKHEKPVAYVSDTLPRMDELRKAKTRQLNGFEEEALTKLEKGEHLIADATVNRIHMVGAVRAATQCLNCHRVERGTLLGAFTYELQRTPPVPVEKAS
jgi:hypothetical protein